MRSPICGAGIGAETPLSISAPYLIRVGSAHENICHTVTGHFAHIDGIITVEFDTLPGTETTAAIVQPDPDRGISSQQQIQIAIAIQIIHTDGMRQAYAQTLFTFGKVTLTIVEPD